MLHVCLCFFYPSEFLFCYSAHHSFSKFESSFIFLFCHLPLSLTLFSLFSSVYDECASLSSNASSDASSTPLSSDHVESACVDGVLCCSEEEGLSRSEASLAEAIGRSIGSLHRTGIVHGDLTTSNIIVHYNRETTETQNTHTPLHAQAV